MTEKLFNGGIFGTETKILIRQPISRSWCEEARDKYLQYHGGPSLHWARPGAMNVLLWMLMFQTLLNSTKVHGFKHEMAE